MRHAMMAASAALALLAGSASGAVILGNYPPTNDTGTTADTDNLRRKALSFSMPAGSDYNITSITLRLQNYITPGDTAILEIRDHTGVGTAPGLTVVGAFTAPASAAAAVGDFVFTPVGTVTLQAGTSYWINVYGANATTSFDWRGSSPSVTPTGIATYGGNSLFTTNGGTSWTVSATINTFQIDGELVPAPGALAVMGLGLIGAARRRR